MTYRDDLIEANDLNQGELLASLQAIPHPGYGALLAMHVLQSAVRTGETVGPKS